MHYPGGSKRQRGAADGLIWTCSPYSAPVDGIGHLYHPGVLIPADRVRQAEPTWGSRSGGVVPTARQDVAQGRFQHQNVLPASNPQVHDRTGCLPADLLDCEPLIPEGRGWASVRTHSRLASGSMATICQPSWALAGPAWMPLRQSDESISVTAWRRLYQGRRRA